jgi:putative hydrolase of HD superfamily
MARLHDIVEVDAGDTITYMELPNKREKELAALARLTRLLPEGIGNEFRSAWIEFDANETAEAKYVSALDRFLPLYSNYLNDGYSWKNHQISADRVVLKNKGPISDGIPDLWKTANQMIEASRVTGAFKQS